MTKSIVAIVSFCLLLPIAHLHAGKVKTIDGKQMPKDSVAELDIHAFFVGYHQDSTWSVGVKQIDSLPICQLASKKGKEPANPDSVFNDPTNMEKLAVSSSDIGWAKKLGKIYLIPGGHDLKIRCVGMFMRDDKMSWVHSLPIPLSVTCLGGHRYRLGAAIVGTDWHVWIEDKDSKEVVADTKQIAE